jgi:DnaJ like chaperone protein
MWWPATLLGIVTGFALASIPGALLGGLLGQVLDRRLKLNSWAALKMGRWQPMAIDDDDLLFILLGRLAKSDGRVMDTHIQLARGEMQRMGLDEPARRKAMDAFTRGKRGTDNLRGPLRQLSARPERAEAVLRTCWRMAWADAKVGTAERELIMLWGRWLGWDSVAVERLSTVDAKGGGAPIQKGGAYQAALLLLGVGPESEPAVIKRAYRRLLSRHHPDKLAGAGASQAQIRAATDKTRELHHAYALVRERHGFR